MSPSEMDLRAALQHGDDDGLSVNPDAIIAEGRAARARRVRILSGAAAAVLVAGGAVGLATLRGDGDRRAATADAERNGPNLNRLSSGGAVGGQKAPQVADPTSSRASAVPSPPVPGPAGGANDATATTCPDTAPHLLVPGGGSPGQFGSDHPLFAKPVAALVVCAYAAADPGGSAPGRLTFNGRQAQQLVASMESPNQHASEIPCDPGATSSNRLLAFIGVTPDGEPLPPVTATVGEPACNVQLTNGTAVRSGWTPPALLIGELRGLTPPKVPPRTIVDEPTAGLNGSPLHS